MTVQLLWLVAITASVMMLIAWIWQCYSRNAGIVDAVWAFGVCSATVIYACFSEGLWQYRLLVGLIGGFWYGRLTLHLLRRVYNEPEDGRYQAVRKYFAQNINVFHFFFFQLQAALICLFSLPMWVIANNAQEFNGMTAGLAVSIAVIAFIGETLADRQLASFRNSPLNRNKTCKVGLWRYSRHPNYFFEWVHWFSYPLLAIGAYAGVWLWAAPVVMLLFLYFITGIPFTEQQAIRSRGDEYREYQRTTSAFIPWRPSL